MAGAISGIGGFRDIGDPRDPRRGESRPLDRAFDDAQIAAILRTPRKERSERMSSELNDVINELQSRLIQRDPDIEAPASMYPARMNIEDGSLAENIQNLAKFGIPRERDVRPEVKKVLQTEGVDPESDFKLGQKIKDKIPSEVAAYGGTQVPVRGADGQVRGFKTIYSDKQSYEEADPLGQIVKDLRMEYKTKITNDNELQRLEREGRFVRRPGDGTEIGYIIDGVDPVSGQEKRTYVYQPRSMVADGLNRVGNSQSRDVDAIRAELKKLDPAFLSGISEQVQKRTGPLIEADPQSQYPASLYPARASLKDQNARAFEETGLVPFLNNKSVRPNIGGVRRNNEGGNNNPISKQYGMPFADLLEELQYGSFMDRPTVVNAFRSLEANDPDIERRIMSLKMAADRTTIPEKAVALQRAAVNLEAGIALVRAERMGREVDIQAFAPDYDSAPGITDVAAEIAELGRGETDVAAEIAELERGETDDFDYFSSGEDKVETGKGNSGFRFIKSEQIPAPQDAVAQSGPVRTDNRLDERTQMAQLRGYQPKFSAAEAQAVRAAYRNPDLAGILRATSQPEIDITNDRIQQAFDERLALLGQKQREQVAPDTGTAVNAPASTGSVTEQQAILDSVPTAARQNIERGLAEGASPASRQGALEFLTRFRSKMFR